MAEAVDKYILQILADNTDAVKKMLQVNQKTDEMEKKQLTMMERLQKGWVGVTAALGGFFLGAKKVLGEFLNADKAATRLKTALEQAGDASKESFQDMMAYSSELQKTVGIADDVGQEMLALAVTMGKSGDGAKKAVKDAAGLAKLYDLDMTQALRGVILAEKGHTEQLGRTIPQLRGVKDASQALAIVQDASRKGIALLNAENETNAGKIKRLQMAFGDFQEVLGGFIAKVILPFVTALTKVFEWITALPAPVQTLIGGLVVLTATILSVGTAVKALGLATAALSANPVTLIISAIAIAALGIAGIISSLKKVREETFKLNQEITQSNLASAEQVLSNLKKQQDELRKTLELSRARGVSEDEYRKKVEAAAREIAKMPYLDALDEARSTQDEIFKAGYAFFNDYGGNWDKFWKAWSAGQEAPETQIAALEKRLADLQKTIDETQSKIKKFKGEQPKTKQPDFTPEGPGKVVEDPLVTRLLKELEFNDRMLAAKRKMYEDLGVLGEEFAIEQEFSRNKELADYLKYLQTQTGMSDEEIQKRVDIFKEGQQQQQDIMVTAASTYASILGQISDLMAGGSKQQFMIKKALGIVEATINSSLAVMETYKNLGGYPLGVPAAIAMAGIGAVNIAKIASQEYSPPSLAAKGAMITEPTNIIAGEAGTELVLPASISKYIMAAVGRGSEGPSKSIYNTYNFNNKVMDKVSLKEFTRIIMRNQNEILSANEAY